MGDFFFDEFNTTKSGINIPIEEGLQREEDLGCPSSFLVKSAVLDPSADVEAASGKGRIVSNRMLMPLLGTSTGWCWPEAVVLFNRRLARWSFAFIITYLNIIYLDLLLLLWNWSYCFVIIDQYAPFWWVWKEKYVQIMVRKGANRIYARNTIEKYWQYWYINAAAAGVSTHVSSLKKTVSRTYIYVFLCIFTMKWEERK